MHVIQKPLLLGTIIVRFESRVDGDCVLKVHKNMTAYNEDKNTKLYIYGDLGPSQYKYIVLPV